MQNNGPATMALEGGKAVERHTPGLSDYAIAGLCSRGVFPSLARHEVSTGVDGVDHGLSWGKTRAGLPHNVHFCVTCPSARLFLNFFKI